MGKIVGPIIGLLLGSFFARVYVDIGSVNTGNTMHFIYKALYKLSLVIPPRPMLPEIRTRFKIYLQIPWPYS
jgi:hypothetical protein